MVLQASDILSIPRTGPRYYAPTKAFKNGVLGYCPQLRMPGGNKQYVGIFFL